MRKYFCDGCGKETERLSTVSIKCHIKTMNDLMGHVSMEEIDGKLVAVRTSGRIEETELCNVCYNKVMVPLWESIQNLKQS